MNKLFLTMLITIVYFASIYSGTSADDFWKRLGGPYGANINKIYVHTNGDIYIATKSDGVFKSMDQGLNWSEYNDNKLNFSHVWINDFIIADNGYIFAVTDSLGIIRKTSASSNWNILGSLAGQKQFKCIYISSNNTIYAGSKGKALFKSGDNGDSWGTIYGGQLDAYSEINCIIENNKGELLVGTDQGIFKNASGTNWTNEGGINFPVYSFAKTRDTILAGTSKGPYSNYGGGLNWNPLNSGMGTDKKVISLAYLKNGKCIAGTEKNGFWISSASGNIWYPYNTGLESKAVQAVSVSNNGKLLTGTNFSFYISDSDTSGWEARINGLGERTVNSFAMLASRGDVMAATDLGVYRTTDNGVNWEQLNNGFKDVIEVNALVISPKGKIYAGTNGDGIYKSTDLGGSWVKDTKFSQAYVNTLDTNSSQVLFAGTRAGIWKLDENLGENDWTQMAGNDIDQKEVISFVRALIGTDEYLYAGTKSDGLYGKSNSENDWKKISVATEVVSIYALAYSYKTDKIYVGSNNGLYRSADGIIWNREDAGSGKLLNPPVAMIIGENGNLLISPSKFNKIFIDSLSGDGTNLDLILDGSKLSDYLVRTLDISGRGYIYVGTQYGGVFRSKESTSDKKLTLETDTTTKEKQQGESFSYNLKITDQNSSAVNASKIIISNDFDTSIPKELFTDATGNVILSGIIPAGVADGLYTISLRATKNSYPDTDIQNLLINVKKRKIYLGVVPDPTKIILADSGQTINFDVTATSSNGTPLEAIDVTMNEDIWNTQDSKATDIDGKVTFSIKIPGPNDDPPKVDPSKTYTAIFTGTSSAGLDPSDPITSKIKISYNPIKIIGETEVCKNVEQIYKTFPDASKTFKWSVNNLGKIIGLSNLDSVKVKWEFSGTGKLTLEQTVSGGNPTSRPLDVIIHEPPLIDQFTTYPDNTKECPMVEINLRNLLPAIPNTGFYSINGVIGDNFKPETGGEYKVTYWIENEFGCIADTTTTIHVHPLPNVTLDLTQKEMCRYDDKLTLSGGMVDGNPVSGEFYGLGISSNEFDPATGPGSYTVTFRYTDPVTNCVNSAWEIFTVKPGLDVSLQMVDKICNTETSFDLSDKTGGLTGEFYVDDILISGTSYDATKDTIGFHKLTFISDSKSPEGCPGKVSVDFEIIPAPGKPFITRDGDRKLKSSAVSNNRWWIVEGNTVKPLTETDQIIQPSLTGGYKVSVFDPITNCESELSDSIHFDVIPLNGKLIVDVSTTEPEPGSIVLFPIKISDLDSLKQFADSISMILSYNGALLFPEENEFTQVVDVANKKLKIYLGYNFNDAESNTTLATLKFTATIGNETTTKPEFEDIDLWKTTNGNVKEIESLISFETPTITIKAPLAGGKSILFDSWNVKQLPNGIIQINPNPAEGSIDIVYNVFEEIKIKIYITDLTGQIIQTVYEGMKDTGEYKQSCDIGNIPTGVYYLIYQTPYIKKANDLRIIR